MASVEKQKSSDEATGSTPCIRCKSQPAAHDLRSENVCTACLVQYIANKAIKRLELLQRETRGLKSPSRPQRYLLALSGGPSSTCLLDVLYDNILQQRKRGQRVKFELLVVHVVDDDGGGGGGGGGGSGVDLMEVFRERFSEVDILSVRLSDVLGLDTIDWSLLPSTVLPENQAPSPQPPSSSVPDSSSSATTTSNSHSSRLAYLFSQLPSATSRADVRRLLTRHLLITTAVQKGCGVLLLGYNTTSLAELTLSETAKGRGFALPWMINDGVLPLPLAVSDGQRGAGGDGDEIKNGSTMTNNITTGIPIYSPLRDIYRKELLVYLTASPSSPSPSDPASSPADQTTTQRPLSTLIPAHLLPPHLQSSTSSGSGIGAVVSHRDLSIDDVMARYFADVEANYPSVVANVVRTTGKLSRLISGGGSGTHDHDHEVDTQTPDLSAGDAPAHQAQAPAPSSPSSSSPAITEPRRRQNPPSRCGICGLQLDEHGNQRWRGELGDFDIPNTPNNDNNSNNNNGPSAAATKTATPTTTIQEQQRRHRQQVRQAGKLCYGCERSILG